MSHQCSCGRDLNNNYVGYTNAYANANTSLDREANSTKSSTGSQTQFTAKLIVGTVGAIKELREKEKSHAMLVWLIFVIIYEFAHVIHCEEYLRELKPKNIKIDIDRELPPVELPRPVFHLRYGRAEVEGDDRQMKSQRPHLIDIALQASVKEGLNAMWQVYEVIEPDMIRNGHILDDDHPAALLSKFSAPMVDSSRREMAAYATLAATKAFRKSYNLNNDLARQAHSQKVSLRRTALEGLCPARDPPTCMPASERYRTHDGTCNNKRRPRWGAAQMPFSRFLPPEYGDGVDSVRQSADGGPLSSSRFVSLLVHGAREGEAPLTLMLAQWGQLLDHDLTSTAQPRSINGSVPSCCGNNDFHPSCFPIKVPLDDPWLSPLKVRCLEFLRSAPAQRRDCVLSWREQTNQATAFIDASPIYSNSVKSSDNARVFRNGLLIFGRGNPNDDACQRGAIATHCIRSGDGRSSEQPGLLALHHVWVGEHNHIAMRLSEMNLHWSDEKVYQETRKIIGAMFQHITYREFLPIVLGREVVKLFDLELQDSGYYEGYDPKTNPGIANAFAAAAFRFGHSLVQNSYTRCDRFHNVLANNVSLHEEFQRGDIGSAGSLHRLVRGMANQRTLKRDEFITPELTNHLFQTPGFPFGLDLAAINIQRGRDHGIPPYTHWRIPCGLSAINTWEEFANVVGPESARRISHAYRNVHDIDLFVGGIAERPVVGGLVGPTFACIIAQQFSNCRKGDRFWYENGRFENSFTPAQLHAVRRVTLASVLCRSVGGGTFQPHIFLPSDVPKNERLPCGVGTLADFDLDPWMEQDPFATPAPSLLQLQTQTSDSSTLDQVTFGPPVLDRIFEIVQAELDTKSADVFPTDNVISSNPLPVAVKGPSFIDQKPGEISSQSSPGFHRIQNVTKISDKLDLKRKGTLGHITKQKPLPGVSNKLDKHSRRGPNRHGAVETTTRKTIIVNNIPIELRSIENKKNDKKDITTIANIIEKIEPRTEMLGVVKSNDDRGAVTAAGDVLKARTEDLDLIETTGLTQTNNDTSTTPAKNELNFLAQTHLNDSWSTKGQRAQFETNTPPQTLVELRNNSSTQPTKRISQTTVSLSSDTEIDPMANSPAVEHRRVQRKLFSPTTERLHINQLISSTLNTLVKSNATLTSANRTLATKSAAHQKRTTMRTSELRQYQKRPSYTKPPKVIVDAGNGDNQYQIEINIRQSNKNQKPPSGTSHGEYTTQFHSNPLEVYPGPHITTPIYAFNPPSPTEATLALGHSKKTKPPTIIFLSEHGNIAPTTRQPGFVHSIVGWSSGGRKPFPTGTDFNERPSVLSGPFQTPRPGIISSFSQTQLGGGVVHATSQSVSNGQYGTISGFASNNGADSTFSFNIRPKPDQTVVNRPELDGHYAYGYTPPKAWFTPRPDYLEHIYPYDNPHRETIQTPFSPANSPTHYIRKKTRPQIKEDLMPFRNPEQIDYDYLGKALNPSSNLTSLDDRALAEEDYDYDEDFENSPLLRKFNQDGYLRPEHMIKTIFISKDKTTNVSQIEQGGTTIPSGRLDDNYVLPAMNSTEDIPRDPIKPISKNPTTVNFFDTQGKHLNNDIFAVELQESDDVTENDFLERTKQKAHRRRISIFKQSREKIAFAPITVLTKPERPDNWVIYDSVKEEPALPQVPVIKMDLSPSSEIPKPIKENIWLSSTHVETKPLHSRTIFNESIYHFLTNFKAQEKANSAPTDTGVAKRPSGSEIIDTTEKTILIHLNSSSSSSELVKRNVTDQMHKTVTDLAKSTDATNDS